jgi:adenosylmethionine-8-amino-7-oxononanoate aminotransferase
VSPNVSSGTGWFVRAIGDTIAICPPLILSADVIALLIARLAASVTEVEVTVG